MARWLAAAVVLSALGCGGRVTEDEFKGFVGRNVADVTARMGQPDGKNPGSMQWAGKVGKKSGGAWKTAYLSYDMERMLVVDAGVSD